MIRAKEESEKALRLGEGIPGVYRVVSVTTTDEETGQTRNYLGEHQSRIDKCDDLLPKIRSVFIQGRALLTRELRGRGIEWDVSPLMSLESGIPTLEQIEQALRFLDLCENEITARDAVKKNGRKRKSTGKRLMGKPLTTKQREALQMIITCNGNRTEAAKRLGITRAALDDRLKGAQLRGEMAKNRSVSARRKLPEDHRGTVTISRQGRR